jgi:hypothetical protein
MKTRTIAGLLAAPLLFAAPAHAMSAAGRSGGATTPVAAPSHSLRRHEAILAVRDEAQTLQEADGGTLTQSHRTYLQAKLDAVRDGIY